MRKLIATYPILYQSKQYEVGEELPASDEKMTRAWLAASTAVWLDDTSKKKTAKPAAAEAGLAGESPNSESPVNLVGKVPETKARSRAKSKPKKSTE